MAKETMTDEQVELEIKRLLSNEAVKLAKKEQQIKYRRRQYLYSLRYMQKHGEELMASGITFENIETVLFSNDEQEDM